MNAMTVGLSADLSVPSNRKLLLARAQRVQHRLRTMSGQNPCMSHSETLAEQYFGFDQGAGHAWLSESLRASSAIPDLRELEVTP